MNLSSREQEIFRQVATGRTTKEIAQVLGIAESTVEWHISNVLVKLDAASRAEAVAICVRDGLIATGEPADLPDFPDQATAAARSRRGRPSETDRVITFDLLGLHLGNIRIRRRSPEAAQTKATRRSDRR
jgi:DNA-binding CsgD family transcriptional regulator